MMKTISRCLCAVLCLLVTDAHAQMIQDPTNWTFSAKKKDATHYVLTANTTIKSGWHIYGLTAGGDGSLIGTSVKLNAGQVKVDGEVTEVTPAKPTTLMDENVNLHSGKATFSVTIAGKKGQVANGSVEYQACNDMMCLPPKTKKFSVKLP